MSHERSWLDIVELPVRELSSEEKARDMEFYKEQQLEVEEMAPLEGDLSAQEKAWLREHYPEVMRRLYRVLIGGIEEETAKVHDQAFKERMMMMATLLAMLLRLNDSELEDLLRRCEGHHDGLPGATGSGTGGPGDAL